MAYKVKIFKQICVYCRALATYEVFNKVNASCGFYCNKHVDQAVKDINKDG